MLKCLLQVRSDLKVVLMSATINLELFEAWAAPQLEAPVVRVPGRLHPIRVEYQPPPPSARANERLDPSPFLRVMQLIDHKVRIVFYCHMEITDVLVYFLLIPPFSAYIYEYM